MSILNKMHMQEYLYDFADDAGAQGVIDLSAKANKAVVPLGAIVKSVTMKVVIAFTSGGAATLTWGDGVDADGYSGTAIAVASLTDNSVFHGNEDQAAPGALLWANIATTPDTVRKLSGQAVTSAATGQVRMTIGAADMTAGRMVVLVEYLLPTEA